MFRNYATPYEDAERRLLRREADDIQDHIQSNRAYGCGRMSDNDIRALVLREREALRERYEITEEEGNQ